MYWGIVIDLGAYVIINLGNELTYTAASKQALNCTNHMPVVIEELCLLLVPNTFDVVYFLMSCSWV